MRASNVAIVCFTVGAAAFCFTAWEAFDHAPADQVPVVLSELGIMAGAGRLLVAGSPGGKGTEYHGPTQHDKLGSSSSDSMDKHSDSEPS